MAEPSQTTVSGSTLVTSHTPTGTRDDAPGSHNDNQNDNGDVPGGMASYYFVFLMLTLCVIGVVVFLNFRRRRKRRLQILHGRVDAFQPDPAAARGRRYWHTRWGSENVSREEGLNEHGEAPPPYMPKRPSQEVQREGNQATDGGPAVPMQTLSRDQAGLKPPDYEEAGGQDDMMRPSQRPGAGGSSSQRQDV